MSALASSKSNAEQMNPTRGEIKRAIPISLALAQLTPWPKAWPEDNSALASPTPMMEPNKVWELEAGKPKYQVPTFQTIAEMSREKTMANPGAEPTWMTSSTGKSDMAPNATNPDEVKTPVKLQSPDQTTATQGFKVWV